MHLLPAERSDHRVIDAERVCQAIAALDDPEEMAQRARLTLLTCIKAAGPISVSAP